MAQATTADAAEPAFLPPGRVVRAGEAEAYRDGRAWLAEARRAAERIRADAAVAAEAEKLRGFEEGRRAGEQEAARLLAETAARVDAYLESVEGEVATLAVDAVARILGSYDETEVAARAVRQALQRFRRDAEITVYVAPAHAAELARRLAAALSDAEARRAVLVEPDPSLAPGRCVLASEAGFVEAGIAEQIDTLRVALGARADRGGTP